jgi:hypothetical protein
MAYEQQEWGTYQYDESKSFTENLAAAKAANALVTTDKIKHIEQGIADKAEKGDKGDPGTAGKDGATGATGAPGKNGSDAKQVKTAVLDEDVNGIVTGGTLTFTDNTTVPITVNKATA